MINTGMNGIRFIYTFVNPKEATINSAAKKCKFVFLFKKNGTFWNEKQSG